MKIRSDIILAIILAVLAAGTLMLEVYRSSANPSSTETALFGVLEFVFSIAFAWIIAVASSSREFRTSQKQFAIAAFRRIREIEKATNRLLARVAKAQEKDATDSAANLEAIQEATLGIRETIKSSISDWSDIIGDELQVMKQIELATQRQASMGSREPLSAHYEGDDLLTELKTTNRSLRDLMNSLPLALQSLVRSDVAERELSVSQQFEALSGQISEKGYISLYAFTLPEFREKSKNLSKGDVVRVCIGDAPGPRSDALVAKDRNGDLVGVFGNTSGLAYHDWTNVVILAIGQSEFEGIVEYVDAPLSENWGFSVRVRQRGVAVSDTNRSYREGHTRGMKHAHGSGKSDHASGEQQHPSTE